jgi:ornithine decarboxylase
MSIAGLKINYILLNKLVTLKNFRNILFSQQGSFYTQSYRRFQNQISLWKRYLPNVQPYYAVKCNPDPILLQWLYASGASFDCASSREIDIVKPLFKSKPIGDTILFANPCKTPKDIDYVKQVNIPWVTLDSLEEMQKMKDASYMPNILLRIAVDDTDSSCPFGAKFGIRPAESYYIVDKAKSLGFSVIGISFHIGSGSTSATAFQNAIVTSKTLWNSFQRYSLVSQFQVLDLGGGWSSEETAFQSQVESVKKGLYYGIQPQRLIAEPGRFFAAPVQDLYVQVVGKKPNPDSRSSGWRYTLDESIYGQFSCIPFDHYSPRIARIKLDPNETARPSTAAALFGRTCDSLDWIANSPYMEELEVGDWLYVPNMGAYTTSTSTEFNGFPKPPFVQTDLSPDPMNLQWLNDLTFPLASMLSVPKPT